MSVSGYVTPPAPPLMAGPPPAPPLMAGPPLAPPAPPLVQNNPVQSKPVGMMAMAGGFAQMKLIKTLVTEIVNKHNAHCFDQLDEYGAAGDIECQGPLHVQVTEAAMQKAMAKERRLGVKGRTEKQVFIDLKTKAFAQALLQAYPGETDEFYRNKLPEIMAQDCQFKCHMMLEDKLKLLQIERDELVQTKTDEFNAAFAALPPKQQGNVVGTNLKNQLQESIDTIDQQLKPNVTKFQQLMALGPRVTLVKPLVAAISQACSNLQYRFEETAGQPGQGLPSSVWWSSNATVKTEQQQLFWTFVQEKLWTGILNVVQPRLLEAQIVKALLDAPDITTVSAFQDKFFAPQQLLPAEKPHQLFWCQEDLPAKAQITQQFNALWNKTDQQKKYSQMADTFVSDALTGSGLFKKLKPKATFEPQGPKRQIVKAALAARKFMEAVDHIIKSSFPSIASDINGFIKAWFEGATFPGPGGATLSLQAQFGITTEEFTQGSVQDMGKLRDQLEAQLDTIALLKAQINERSAGPNDMVTTAGMKKQVKDVQSLVTMLQAEITCVEQRAEPALLQDLRTSCFRAREDINTKVEVLIAEHQDIAKDLRGRLAEMQTKLEQRPPQITVDIAGPTATVEQVKALEKSQDLDRIMISEYLTQLRKKVFKEAHILDQSVAHIVDTVKTLGGTPLYKQKQPIKTLRQLFDATIMVNSNKFGQVFREIKQFKRGQKDKGASWSSWASDKLTSSPQAFDQFLDTLEQMLNEARKSQLEDIQFYQQQIAYVFQSLCSMSQRLGGVEDPQCAEYFR